MFKKSLLIIALALVLTACAPSAQQLATPVAATIAAWPTQTSFPTYTPYPTLEPLPTLTPVPTLAPKVIVVTVTPTATPAQADVDHLKEDLRQGVVVLIQEMELANKVNQVVWEGDNLKIEIFLNYASEDFQLSDHFGLVQLLSNFFDTAKKDNSFAAAYNEKTVMSLTSFSKLGEYKISSVNSLEVMNKLNQYQLSQSEWQALAIQK